MLPLICCTPIVFRGFHWSADLRLNAKESVSPFGLRKLGVVFEWCEHNQEAQHGDHEDTAITDDTESELGAGDNDGDQSFEYDVTATDVDGGGLGRGGWDGTGSGGLHNTLGVANNWSSINHMKPNRGGSFRRQEPEAFTTYAIEYDSPEVKQDDLGFRCCFSFADRDEADLSFTRQRSSSHNDLFLAFHGEDAAMNFNPTFG